MPLTDFWYIAAEAREVDVRPVRRVLFGRPLVLFRDDHGRPAALLDRCAHRNVALSGGRVTPEGCLECPYHGWRYDAGGDCVHVPSLGPGGHVPGSTRVPGFPARERDGYLWVWANENSAPVGEPLAFPHHGEPGWTHFRMRTRFAATVESCLENFLDCPHTVFVHRGWFRSPDTRALTAVVRRRAAEVEVEFRGEPISESLVSRLLFPKGKELRHTDRFLMPNVSRVDYDFGPERHFVITSQCTPIGPRETEVFTEINYRFGAWGPLVRLFFEPMSRRIIRQDVDILAAQDRQFTAFGGREEFAHVETDLLGRHIHALRAACERGDAPRVGENAEREITIRF